jgi:predicted nucleic acid-binding protein
MKAMLDTSVMVAGIPADIIEEIEEYCSSTICRAELTRGLTSFESDETRHQQASARRELLRLLDAVPGFWADFDRAAADGYGRLAVAPRGGTRVRDALIAGHALSRELALITTDKHFTRYPGVRLHTAGQESES